MIEHRKDRTYKKTRLVPLKLELQCNDCEGMMEYNGLEDADLSVNPPLMPHYCNKCNIKEMLPINYPRIIHEEL